MLEEEYYEFAVKRNKKNLMDEYWKEVARTGVWISKDGKETAFSDMELGHLLNVVRGLLEFENENCKLVVKKIITELTIRATRKTPKYAFYALEKLTRIGIESSLGKDEEEEIKELSQTIKKFL